VSERADGTPQRLPREIVRLGWISFFLDVASEMVYPLIPLFVASTLRAPGFALGLIEGCADALHALMTALSGRTSDRIRRRVPFVRWGYGVAALSKPLLALVGSWPAMLALRAADRFGKGLRTAPRDALIVDLAGPKRLGAAFGFHRAMDTAGALVGVLLSLALLRWLPGEYRTVFALTTIPGAVAVALAFGVREPEAPSASAPRARPPISALPASLWRVLVPLWIFALGNSSDTFLLLRASDSGFNELEVVGAYALMNVTYAAVSFPAGRSSDRWGRGRVIAIGWATYALVYAGFAWLAGPALWGAFALYGAYLGLTQGVAKAWVADHAPAELRATALGLYQLGASLALLAASAGAGLLWDRAGHELPFQFGAAAAALALLSLPGAIRASRAA
jgi:MFS family permease